MTSSLLPSGADEVFEIFDQHKTDMSVYFLCQPDDSIIRTSRSYDYRSGFSLQDLRGKDISSVFHNSSVVKKTIAVIKREQRTGKKLNVPKFYLKKNKEGRTPKKNNLQCVPGELFRYEAGGGYSLFVFFSRYLYQDLLTSEVTDDCFVFIDREGRIKIFSHSFEYFIKIPARLFFDKNISDFITSGKKNILNIYKKYNRMYRETEDTSNQDKWIPLSQKRLNDRSNWYAMNEEPENITVLPNGNINLECRPDKDSILYLEKYNWIYMKDKIDQINNNIRIDFTIKSGGKDFIAKAFLFGLSYDLTREQKTSKFPDQRGFLCGIEYESRAMRAITEIKKAARYRSRQNRKVSFDKPRRVRVQKTGPYISVSIDGKKYSDYLDTNIVTDKTLDNVGFCLLGDCEVTDIEIFTSPAKFRPEEFLENFELRFINNPSLIYHATILENSNKNNFLMVVLKNISEVRRIEKEKETFFEKQKAELEVAKKIQKSFINKALGNILGVDIKYFFLPSNSIGGDLFDTVSLNDHTSYFIIFDVCGKGIPAALINTALKSFFLSAVKNNPEDPESVLREVNEKFMDTFPFDEHHLFATAVCTRIDTKSNSFKISRAGHCYPLYRTSKSSSPEVIKPDGAIIGFFRNSRFPVIERKFGYGDSLFLYTDGIEEIKVNGACPFKLENLIKLISGNGIKQADILIENIRNTIKPHKSGINSYDDSTLVVLSRVPHDES